MWWGIKQRIKVGPEAIVIRSVLEIAYITVNCHTHKIEHFSAHFPNSEIGVRTATEIMV